MKLVVGLGNPGERYAKTRHNVGFMVLDKLIKKYVATPQSNKKLGAILYSLDKERMLIKPQTFMNSSGGPVANIVRFYKIKPEGLLIVHDDVDLPFGEVRQQFARGSAGHRGVQSIIDSLGTEGFNRVRIGVGRPYSPIGEKMETDAYVLQKFTEGGGEVTTLIQKSADIVSNWLTENPPKN